MKYTPSRAAVALVSCLGLLLAALVAVTPAGASLGEAATRVAPNHHWGKIWNRSLKRKADKRYYTKAKSNRRYYTKAQVDGTFYTKAQVDGTFHTKAESDAKYESKHSAYRGMYLISGRNAGTLVTGDISFGATLAAPPTAHYIPQGTAPPAGCSGNATAPDADAGHLCVWETDNTNVGARFVTNAAFVPGTATTTGAYLYTTIAGAGNGFVGGTWVMRPGGTATVTNARRTTLGRSAAGLPR